MRAIRTDTLWSLSFKEASNWTIRDWAAHNSFSRKSILVCSAVIRIKVFVFFLGGSLSALTVLVESVFEREGMRLSEVRADGVEGELDRGREGLSAVVVIVEEEGTADGAALGETAADWKELLTGAAVDGTKVNVDFKFGKEACE